MVYSSEWKGKFAAKTEENETLIDQILDFPPTNIYCEVIYLETRFGFSKLNYVTKTKILSVSLSRPRPDSIFWSQARD